MNSLNVSLHEPVFAHKTKKCSFFVHFSNWLLPGGSPSGSIDWYLRELHLLACRLVALLPLAAGEARCDAPN
jgi:hypothetical protein